MFLKHQPKNLIDRIETGAIYGSFSANQKLSNMWDNRIVF